MKTAWPTQLFAGVVLALGASAWYLPLWQQQRTIRTLQAQIARLAPELEEVRKLQRVYEDLRESSRRSIKARRTTRPIVDIVLELTNLLPNDTWLHHLQIKAGEVVMTGETQRGTDLLERLERSPMFEQVRFVSPLARIPGSLYARFHVSASLQGYSQ